MGSRKGFTMIELILAMGFLATLLITIALLVNMITGVYQKGLSLRAVNAAGKQLVDELSRTVGGSPIVKDINPEDANNDGKIGNTELAAALNKYFYTNPQNGAGSQQNGVFCTGSSSYIWNTQPTYSAWRENNNAVLSGALQIMYQNPDSSWTSPAVYKMARVSDSERKVCADALAGEIVLRVSGAPVELINADEADLILYDFSVFPATQNTITGQTFYSATFILGTMVGGVNILDSGNFCNENDNPLMGTSGLVSDFNYCAVNKFNFAMRATGFTEGEDQYGER
jgi:hypothetical protein